MSRLRPEKVHVTFLPPTTSISPIIPRCYTLTHSDRTGDLFLSIGPRYDASKLKGLLFRIMRDEVVAKWERIEEKYVLLVYCEVSKGIGGSRWRYSIFKSELPLVLEAFRFGDNELFERFPDLDSSEIIVNFLSNQKEYSKTEHFGPFHSYQFNW